MSNNIKHVKGSVRGSGNEHHNSIEEVGLIQKNHSKLCRGTKLYQIKT